MAEVVLVLAVVVADFNASFLSFFFSFNVFFSDTTFVAP
jgi:hypothetical protein